MRVLLVDDHKMMRDGLRSVLEGAGLEVAGEASDGHEAVREAARLRPDAVVIDIAMPSLNGIDAARKITAELPGLKVVALSMSADQRYVMAMLEAGAVGYLLKNAAATELITALQTVARGETYLSPAVARGVVDHAILGGPPSSRSAGSLSPREREVLQLVAEGKSSKETASILGVAVPTVETHRRQIMRKLKLRSVAELTKYAIREGITSSDG